MREGAALDPSGYTKTLGWSPEPFSRTIDVDRVLAEFEAGATIVVQALHHNWGPLASFSRSLEVALGEPVQANAYFTPASAQGLTVHHDTHDVFVLQVAGEKHWRVYEPVVELPLQSQRYSRSEHGGPGTPVEDCVLRAGDTMYLPRGWLHDALTTESESLHLTIGVKVYTWLDAVKEALEDCDEEVGFRRSVPEDGELRDDLLAELAEQLSPARVVERKRTRLVRSRRPVREGQLSQLRLLEGLTLDTPLERRPAVTELDFPELAFDGKSLTFPEHVEEEVEFVASAEGAFSAGDLPGSLDDSGRLVLVRRLVREGFLRIQA